MKRKAYKIWDKIHKVYVNFGYNHKHTWLCFPSEVLKESHVPTQELFDERYEIHQFEMILTKKFNFNKKEVNEGI